MRPYPEICRLTVRELADALGKGELASLEITEAYLASIAAQNDAIFAYLDVYAQSARAEGANAPAPAGCFKTLFPRTAPRWWRSCARRGCRCWVS